VRGQSWKASRQPARKVEGLLIGLGGEHYPFVHHGHTLDRETLGHPGLARPGGRVEDDGRGAIPLGFENRH
jgi:hypothetical protein